MGGASFDVGSSMMFGFGPNEGPDGRESSTNLLTRALAAVGQTMKTIPDPTQIHYHLPPSARHPDGLGVKVWRDYDQFLAELTAAFPHEAEGIAGFYGECWKVFDALNALELRSLEEPRYLLGQFVRNPLACLTLAWYLPQNAGDVARRHIRDEELLSFIDMECYCWSTVKAAFTPMINAGMVFCDRHYGGVRYPEGGVGRIAEALVAGLAAHGGEIRYGKEVTQILTEAAGPDEAGEAGVRAVGVRLRNGEELRAKTVVSNATRWDTFGRLVDPQHVPASERSFLGRYRKSPSFTTLHLGVQAEALPWLADCECHHILLEDWAELEDTVSAKGAGTLFVSIPSVLDPTVAPEGHHLFHAFTPDWVEDWDGLSRAEYKAQKERVKDRLIERLEALAFPGLGAAVTFCEVGTPKTNRKFLNREDGTYGPIPARRPTGLLGMPFNRTDVPGLYAVGDR